MKTTISLAAIMVLSGCMATGAAYSPAAMNTGKAQLVIYRPSGFMLGGVPAAIEINGVSKCSLSTSGYMIDNIEPGQTVVAADTWQLPGTSKLMFNAKAGHKYYVKVSVNGNKGALRALGGIIASETMSGQSGPFLVELTGNDNELSGYKESCK